jgi:hypothetical protein
MKPLVTRLIVALGFGFGALAAPAALIMFEAVNTPRPELRDPAGVRALLHETRLAWEDQRAMTGTSAAPEFGLPEAGSGD